MGSNYNIYSGDTLPPVLKYALQHIHIKYILKKYHAPQSEIMISKCHYYDN